MPFGERKEEAAERKRTARTATNQIPNLWKRDGNRSNHSDNAFSNRHGGAELDWLVTKRTVP